MSVLSEDTQQSVQDNLLKDGLITADKISRGKAKSRKRAPIAGISTS